MKKYLFFLWLFVCFSCNKEIDEKYDKNEKLIAFNYMLMDIDLKKERIIIRNNPSLMNIIEEGSLENDTIKMELTQHDYHIIDSLYLANKIYAIPSGEVENDGIISESNNLKIILEGKNNNRREISIWEFYNRNSEVNKRVINYVNKINQFLDEKMKKDSLYQLKKYKINMRRSL